MKRAILAALAGLLIHGTGSPVGAAETLRGAVTTALANHPAVAAEQAGRRAAILAARAERSGFFPRFTASVEGGYGYEETDTTRAQAALSGDTDEGEYGWNGEGRLRLSQMLFDGFATASRTEAAEIDIDAQTAVLEDAEELIALRAALAYLDLMRTRAILAIAVANVENHEAVLAEVQRKQQAGAGDAADVAQAQSRLALAHARLVDITGQAENAEHAYAEAVGALPEQGLTQPERLNPYLPPMRDEAVQIALAHNPGLRSLRLAAGAADTRIDVAASSLSPTVDLDLDYRRGWERETLDGETQEARALVRLNWSLATGGGEFARRNRAREEAEQARELARERERLVIQQTSQAWTNMLVAREQLIDFYERERAAQEVVRSYRRQFEAARRSLLDVLDVENELFEARIAAANGVFRVLSTEYRLLANLGRLITSIETATAAPVAGDRPDDMTDDGAAPATETVIGLPPEATGMETERPRLPEIGAPVELRFGPPPADGTAPEDGTADEAPLPPGSVDE